ncbi:MAG TPA: hypothetical protein VFC45_07005 [Pseudolabrys sp.]|nr:hypothetical protein [Pseudolabrys sp.]
MRVIAIAALAIAMLARGMASQSAPRAPEQAGAAINPAEMHKTIDMKTLPEQQAADLF